MVKQVRFFLLLSAFCLFSSFSFGAVVTQTFTVAAEADDGIATAAGLQSISDAHLAIGDDRTYTLPYQMSAMRFANIDIPRSADIISANLKIRSLDSEYRGSVKGVIRAEAVDNAPDYTGRNISDAPLTAAAVDWDHKSNWSTNTWYTSPDIAPLIQQTIDRPNWQTSNAAALYYSTRTETGKQRFFAAFSTAPAQLEITYEYYRLSGTVTTTAGPPLQGVQINAGPDIETATTDATGYYELNVPPGWTGTVTVAKDGWGFTEWSHTYSNITTDQTAENFTAFQPTISGTTTQPVVTLTATGVGTVVSTPTYTITVPYGWTGNISAELAGYHFADSPKTYTNVTSNKIEQDFTPYQPTISGTTGQAGATVTVSGVGSVTSTPDYDVTVPYDWTGAVSASLMGYHFTDSPKSYTNVTSSKTSQNFTPYQPTISGSTSVSGATVTISGVGTVTSTPAYSVAIPYGWTGTVSASLAGYHFGDLPKSYTNVTSNKANQNFTPYQPRIAGITVSGATVTVSGVGSFVSSPTYIVVVPYGWSGTVSASLTGYYFPDSPHTYVNVVSNKGNQNFTSFQPTISGYVRKADGTAISDVSITTDSNVGSDMTDGNGYYEVVVPYGWSGTVNISRPGWVTETEGATYSNVTNDLTGQDFTGTLICYSFPEGQGTEDDPYLIDSAQQLDVIREADYFLNSHFRLIANIDMSGYDGRYGNPSFNMIGSEEMPFRGVFDGGGFTISSLYIYVGATTNYCGLFGSCSQAVIKNLTLSNPYISARQSDYVGAFAGNGHSTSFINCHIIDGQVRGRDYVGGMAGDQGFYNGCSASLSVSGRNRVGGFTGVNGGFSECLANCDVTASGDYGGGFTGSIFSGYSVDYTDCTASGTVSVSGEYAGGIIGHSYSSDIENCNVSISISGGGSNIGGIAGSIRDSSSLNKCSAVVSISKSGYVIYVGGMVGSMVNGCSLNECSAEVSVNGSLAVGGLVGYMDSGWIHESSAIGSVSGGGFVGGLVGINEGAVSSCWASVNVTGGGKAGGLVGVCHGFHGKVINCYATGTVSGSHSVGGLIGVSEDTSSVEYCYSSGQLSGSSGVGGLIGLNTALQPLNCYWDMDLSGQSESQGGTGKTNAEMKTAQTFIAWSHDNQWTIDEGVSSPHLAWENKPGEPMPEAAYWPGSGTAEDPFLIYTAEDLVLMYDGSDVFSDRHYKVMADIDLSGYDGLNGNLQYQPLKNFAGVFDGNCKTISNLSITTLSQSDVGLFGTTESSAIIKDVRLVNPVVVVPNKYRIGSLGGDIKGQVLRCCSEGGMVNGYNDVGGLIGHANYLSSIELCYSTTNADGNNFVGGLIGSTNGATVLNCYARGRVSAFYDCGGLIGRNTNPHLVIHCYSTGRVNGSTSQFFLPGGLIGSGLGSRDVTLDSYWDIQTSNQTSSYGGTGKTTTEMQMMSTYIAGGWDFVDETDNGTEDIWTICEGTNYPRLVWQIPAGDYLCPEGVSVEDLSYLTDHWLATDYGLVEGAELTGDGRVNFDDLIALSDYWLTTGCGDCDGRDLTGDGDVNLADFAYISKHWNMTEYGSCDGAELTGDGKINLEDFALFVEKWLTGVK